MTAFGVLAALLCLTVTIVAVWTAWRHWDGDS